MSKNIVYVVAAKRTPIGSFGGALASVSATHLGAVAIKSALAEINLDPNVVDEVLMGSVLQAGLGQAPARQAAKFAGLPDKVNCTTINKVCASGMKAVIVGAQSIMLGDNEVVVAGGMENMSAVPYYAPSVRWGAKYGAQQLIDGLEKDGLTDVYGNFSMGNCGELCATNHHISRKEQDDYAVRSYERAAAAWKAGSFAKEIAPVTIHGKKGDIIVQEDEEYKKVIFEKIPQLKSAFVKDGSITAANSSTLSDGAAALVLMSKHKAEMLGLKPLAIITNYADAEQAPELFTTTPSIATGYALKKAGLQASDIDYYEFNEAYAVVALANARLLDIPIEKVNIHGGAVALGHPLGCSGARILVTLINVLAQKRAKYGLASICNGGGGASALILENKQM